MYSVWIVFGAFTSYSDAGKQCKGQPLSHRTAKNREKP